MLLDIPFYENNEEGNQCMQAAIKMVIKHFLGEEYSLDKLDQLTERKEGKWTYTSQGAVALCNLGLNIKYYCKMDLEPFLEGESFIRRHFGKDADKILQYTDMPSMKKSYEKLLSSKIFEKKALKLIDIEEVLENYYVPIVLIDDNKISGKENQFLGHYVVVTGFDDKHIYYHESGPNNPKPNRKVLKDIFNEAFNANGTDNDVIIVYGKG